MKKYLFSFVCLSTLVFTACEKSEPTVIIHHRLSVPEQTAETQVMGSQTAGHSVLKSADEQFTLDCNVAQYGELQPATFSGGFSFCTFSKERTGFEKNYYAMPGKGASELPYVLGYINYYSRLDANYKELIYINNPTSEVGYTLSSVYVTNVMEMKKAVEEDGAFSKKLSQGEYVKLTISDANDPQKAVECYLADYRQDKLVVVEDWQMIDLGTLGSAEALKFDMTTKAIDDEIAAAVKAGKKGAELDAIRKELTYPAYFCLSDLTFITVQ